MRSKFKAGLDAIVSPVEALKENPACSERWLPPITLLMILSFIESRVWTGRYILDLVTFWMVVLISPVLRKKCSIA